MATGQSSSMLLVAMFFMTANAMDGTPTPPLMRRYVDAAGKVEASGSLLELDNLDNFNAIIKDAGVSLNDFNLKAFDKNGDGKLSASEVKEALPTLKQKGVIDSLIKKLNDEKQREAKDREVFKVADLDGSSFLETEEVENLLDHTNVNRDAFNWREYDDDKDDKLSEDEFLEAGKAASKSQMPAPENDASFTETDEDEADSLKEHNRRTVDRHIFEQADTNNDGSLDEHEVKALMTHAGNMKTFPWKEHDDNEDGKLSEDEFLEAGPAASHHQETEKMDRQYFKNADKDDSSFVEGDEMDSFVKDAGLSKKYFKWQDHDEDGDDRLSEDEFVKASPAAEKAAFIQAQDSMKRKPSSDDDETNPSSADSDDMKNDALPEGPPTSVADVSQTSDAADSDSSQLTDAEGDGEFAPDKTTKESDGPSEMSTDPIDDSAKKKKSEDGPNIEGDAGSAVEKSMMKKLQKSRMLDLQEDDEIVFKMGDRNHDGILSASEVHRLLNRAGLQGFRWKLYDTNSDGKLNKEEFANASQEMKDRVSKKFRKEVLLQQSKEHQAPPEAPIKSSDFDAGDNTLMQASQRSHRKHSHHQSMEADSSAN